MQKVHLVPVFKSRFAVEPEIVLYNTIRRHKWHLVEI